MTTPNFGLVYPGLMDPPNGPSAVQNLATSIDNNLTGYRGLWQATTAQTINNNVETKVTYNVAGVTANGISYAAGVFTILRAGRWHIKGAVYHRWFSASTASYAWVGPSGATTTRWDQAQVFHPATSPPVPELKHGFDTERIFAVNDTFAVWTWHNEGSNRPLAITVGGPTHVDAQFKGN